MSGGGGSYFSVVPVITAGLHCGEVIENHGVYVGPVVPVITAGLHCGRRRPS